MLDKINIRMTEPVNTQDLTSFLDVPSILILLVVNYLKGIAQNRMSPKDLAMRFEIGQISTTNLKRMSQETRTAMLAAIIFPESRKSAINMFVEIGDYTALESKDLYERFLKTGEEACKNELVTRRLKDIDSLLSPKPTKAESKAFMAILEAVYKNTPYWVRRTKFTLENINVYQARKLSAIHTKNSELRKVLTEKAKLTDTNLSALSDDDLRAFVKEEGFIPFLDEYAEANKPWGTILERLGTHFISNGVADNRKAFATGENETLLLRLVSNLQARSELNIGSLKEHLNALADTETIETCAVILNALPDPRTGLTDMTEKQKNQLYAVALKFHMPKLQTALDGRDPEQQTTVQEDLRHVTEAVVNGWNTLSGWFAEGVEFDETTSLLVEAY